MKAKPSPRTASLRPPPHAAPPASARGLGACLLSSSVLGSGFPASHRPAPGSLTLRKRGALRAGKPWAHPHRVQRGHCEHRARCGAADPASGRRDPPSPEPASAAMRGPSSAIVGSAKGRSLLPEGPSPGVLSPCGPRRSVGRCELRCSGLSVSTSAAAKWPVSLPVLILINLLSEKD